MQAKPGHYYALDSLRGLGCLIVALWHWPSAGPFHPPELVNATVLVDFFFILSGFVMGANYDGRINTTQEAVRFTWLRIGRIYPLHFAMLLVMVAWECLRLFQAMQSGESTQGLFEDERNIPAIFSNLFLIQTFGMHDAPTWNDPSWSIGAEMYTYIAFALVTLWAGRFKYWAYAALIVLCYVVLIRWSDEGLFDTVPLGVFRAMLGFFIGSFLWKGHVWLRARPEIVKLPFAVWTVVEVAVFGGLILYMFNFGPGDWMSYLAPPLLCIFVMTFASEKGGISHLLQGKRLVDLGNLSFSVYMIHVPLIAMLWPVMGAIEKVTGLQMMHERADGFLVFGATPLMGDLLYIPFIILTVFLSWVSFKYYEDPMRRAFKDSNVGKKKRPSAPTVAASA